MASSFRLIMIIERGHKRPGGCSFVPRGRPLDTVRRNRDHRDVITIACTCGKSLKVADEAAGTMVACPACGEVVAALPATRVEPAPRSSDGEKTFFQAPAAGNDGVELIRFL